MAPAPGHDRERLETPHEREMGTTMNGRCIHRLRDIYHPNCQAGLSDGRWVAAVAEPYTAGSLWAAWAVLTGKAVAFQWPKPGDLEDIFKPHFPLVPPTTSTGGRPSNTKRQS